MAISHHTRKGKVRCHSKRTGSYRCCKYTVVTIKGGKR